MLRVANGGEQDGQGAGWSGVGWGGVEGTTDGEKIGQNQKKNTSTTLPSGKSFCSQIEITSSLVSVSKVAVPFWMGRRRDGVYKGSEWHN